MKFVNPYFLFGLFAIAVPVIIHLFNFRRFKKVFFSNVEFLKELKQETQKKSKLKHLLVLICRILAVTCLVLAFAQPYMPVKENKINAKGNVISIYIDNSFSMQATSSKGTLFEEAKSKALEIANTYKSTDLFQILTNDFEGKHQAFVTREEFIQMVNELEISPAYRTLSDILMRQQDLFSTVNSKGKISFIIGDFSKKSCDFSTIKADSSIDVNLVQLAANERNNLYIDSCWFASPVMQSGQQAQLTVLIKNASENEAESIPVKLIINGKQKSVASVNIPALSEAEVKLPYTLAEKGIQSASIEIIDNPIVFDDKFYFNYSVTEKIPVLSLNNKSASDYINSLFGKDSAFVLTNTDINKIDYSALPENNLVVLNELKSISSGMTQEFQNYVKNGGCLLIFPGTDADIDSYKSFLSGMSLAYFSGKDTVNTKVSSINTEHHIYKDVFDKIPENIDLPKVYSHYKFSSKSFTSDEYLMKMQNGESFMISGVYGRGTVFISSVPLNMEFSNFAKHAMFVPTLYNIALFSKQVNKLYYTIGKDEAVEVKNFKMNNDMTFRITNKARNFEIIPEHKNVDLQTDVYPHDQIKDAGNYIMFSGEDTVCGLAYNYDRNESDMKFYSSDELQNEITGKNLKNFNLLDLKNKSVSKVLDEINQGFRLWKFLVILCIFFLLSEVLLLRFLNK
jgi:hypothetical protein